MFQVTTTLTPTGTVSWAMNGPVMRSTLFCRVFKMVRGPPQWHPSLSGANRMTGGSGNKAEGRVSCDSRSMQPLSALRVLAP